MSGDAELAVGDHEGGGEAGESAEPDHDGDRYVQLAPPPA
jgi:hypothetical protein